MHHRNSRTTCSAILVAFVYASLTSCTCSNSVNSGNGDSSLSDGSTLDGSNTRADSSVGSGDASVDGPFRTNDAGQVLCGNHVCQCSDGIDNDSDQTTDLRDVECTGPYDDDESSFSTGIPGDNRDPMWQDCFFDGNSGAGDDHCRYRTECLTGQASGADCTLSNACLEFCRPRTPNGCDCFGCCAVQLADRSTVNIIIGGQCTEEGLNNPQLCPRCTQNTQCVNPCGRCELCLGVTPEELPPDCANPDAGVADGGSASPHPWTCDNGAVPCESVSECGGEAPYCYLGCCMNYLQ